MGCTRKLDSGAGSIVQDGWNQWSGYAADAVSDASEFLHDLSDINFTPIATNIPFAPVGNLGTPFSKPPTPSDPDLNFKTVSPVGNPYIPPIVPFTGDPKPVLDADKPDLNIPPPPSDLIATAPDDPPDPTAIVIPTAPVITLPPEPVLDDITLPPVPDITLPDFTGVVPTTDAVAPGNTFNFEYEDYTENLPSLMTRIQTMLAGGTGLPAAIWDALWDKGRAREEKTATKLVQEVTDEWAARGFTLPGGVLDKKIVAARQAVQDAENQLSRDIAIQQATMEAENLKFAVAQGIAYENMQIGLHMQQMQLTFEASRYAIEAAVSIFNAKIALYNVEIQAYVAEVQVYKTLIEAEMTNVELYRAQLEGQKLIGELNLQDIEVYKARLTALLTHVEVYKGELDGVKALVDVDKNKVDLFTARVAAFAEQVNAKESEVSIFAERIKAELARITIYDTEVNAFAKEVEAYRSGNDADINGKRIELESNGFILDKFKADVMRYAAEIDAEAKRVGAGVDIYSGQSRMYAAELGAESARVSSDTRHFELGIQEAKANADVEIKEAQLNIEQLLRILSLEIDKGKTILGVQSQLAAAAMAAVNLSAGVSDSVSSSSGCSETYSY